MTLSNELSTIAEKIKKGQATDEEKAAYLQAINSAAKDLENAIDNIIK